MSRKRFVYGPVASRRLGRSLGVDLIPFKTCPYDCIYCQLGPTTEHTRERRRFIAVETIVDEVRAALARHRPDFISLAGSGEPTLYEGLGALVEALHGITPVPVALLTNAALFGDRAVRMEAGLTDLVIPSLDAGDEDLFAAVNRPVAGLLLEEVVEGLAAFRHSYRGQIWLEVMVTAGLTDGADAIAAIARQARRLAPDKIQLNTPVRPAPGAGVIPVAPERLEALASAFCPKAEVIAACAVDRRQDGEPSTPADSEILELLARRPCSLQDLAQGLAVSPNAVLKALGRLVAERRVQRLSATASAFYTVVRADAEDPSSGT
jgi:wyosine [tRNA(Phe)-imidazoG37] synthetase (radical SAM superfamily)